MKSTVLKAVFFVMILTAVIDVPAVAQSAVSAIITKANLKQSLENLGYETIDLGADTYQIKLVQSASVPISVALSPDGSRIWLITNLGNKELSNLSSERLIKILQSNRNIGTSFFALSTNRLEMLSFLENRSMTPVLLRKAIELQARNVSDTMELWDDGTIK
jgi:hypothetical protein